MNSKPQARRSVLGHVDPSCDKSTAKLRCWCWKAWEGKLKFSLFFKEKIIFYGCCTSFMDKELIIRGGHPAAEAVDLYHFFAMHQITSPETLFQTLLILAKMKEDHGDKMVFPGMNRSHSGVKLWPGKYLTQEEEVAAVEKSAEDAKRRCYHLEYTIGLQRQTIYGLERDKLLLEDKIDDLNDLVSTLRSKISLLEASLGQSGSAVDAEFSQAKAGISGKSKSGTSQGQMASS